jgi:hypothetical protein
MKKLFNVLLVASLGTIATASAQIQQGNVLLGGNLADVKLGLDKPNVFDFNITPKAAWFVQDNIALGAYVNFGIETAKESNTVTSYGVGVLGRYYTGSDVEVLRHGRLFGEITAGIGGNNVSGGGGSTNGLDFGVGPGFAYFVTPNIGLELLLKYKGLGGFGDVGYQSNLNLSFGLQVYLPGSRTASKVRGDVRK